MPRVYVDLIIWRRKRFDYWTCIYFRNYRGRNKKLLLRTWKWEKVEYYLWFWISQFLNQNFSFITFFIILAGNEGNSNKLWFLTLFQKLWVYNAHLHHFQYICTFKFCCIWQIISLDCDVRCVFRISRWHRITSIFRLSIITYIVEIFCKYDLVLSRYAIIIPALSFLHPTEKLAHILIFW